MPSGWPEPPSLPFSMPPVLIWLELLNSPIKQLWSYNIYNLKVVFHLWCLLSKIWKQGSLFFLFWKLGRLTFSAPPPLTPLSLSLPSIFFNNNMAMTHERRTGTFRFYGEISQARGLKMGLYQVDRDIYDPYLKFVFCLWYIIWKMSLFETELYL